MKLDELRQLQGLLEKAQAHAKLQAAYTSKPPTAALWRNFENDCQTIVLDVKWAISATNEALHHETE